MISKPILLFLAVLVACTIAQKGKNKTNADQHRELLAMGLNKKYVDEMQKSDIQLSKDMKAAKGDPEKVKKVKKHSDEIAQAFYNKLPKEQGETFMKWFDLNPEYEAQF